MNIGATLSTDGQYRYDLRRVWEADKSAVHFIMLNPSTADASGDDPTIRRCIEFAKDWGYGALVVTNLFALRATDPRKLKEHADPIGSLNDVYIAQYLPLYTVCAWGNYGTYKGRCYEVEALIGRQKWMTYCLTKGKDAHPKHPLYLRKNLQPIPFANCNGEFRER